jgi:hypothetical protein
VELAQLNFWAIGVLQVVPSAIILVGGRKRVVRVVAGNAASGLRLLEGELILTPEGSFSLGEIESFEHGCESAADLGYFALDSFVDHAAVDVKTFEKAAQSRPT